MRAADALVGREGVLRQARVALDAAAAGHGGLVLVAGEPGIGKSAFVSAVAEDATAHGATVAWGVCWESEGAPPFWPWAQVLQALSEHVDVGEAAPLVPGLAAPGPAADDDPGSRFRLFASVTEVLRRSAPDGVLVVALEDLQWADEPSLLLLEFAVRHLRSSAVLVVGTYRDTEGGVLLRRLAGTGQVITLGGLGPDDVRSVMAQVAGADPAPSLVDAVVRRTAGNPLFVRELTRLLEAQGGDQDRPAVRTGIPDSVRSALDGRLARLSERCAQMLASAALLGAEVRPEVLDRLTGGGTDVAGALDEAVRARVLTAPTGPLGPHRFAHDLFREALEESLTPRARAEGHLAAGRALAALRAEGAAVHPAQLAAHFARATSVAGTEEAVHWSTLAAEEASARLAWEDAVAHYERALTALELGRGDDPGLAADLLLGLAAARNRSGDAGGAQGAYRDVARLARALEDPVRLGRAALGVQELGALTGTPHDEPIALLEEAAGGLAGSTTPLRARVLAGLARELHHSWRPAGVARAPVVAEEAVTLARDTGDPATLAVCLLALHDSRWIRASAHVRLQALDELAPLAAAANDRELVAQAHLLRAAALLELGDPEGRSELREYCRLADDLGHARARWGALSRRATEALLVGRLDDAEHLMDESYRLGRDIGEPDAYPVWSAQMSQLGRLRGRSLEAVEAAGLDAYGPLFRSMALAEAGEGRAAAELLAGFTIDDVPPSPDDRFVILAADALAVAGDEGGRTRAYEALLPLRGLQVVIGGCVVYVGPIDHRLGQLAHALGRTGDAVAHLDAAIAQAERLGASSWAALSRAELERIRPRPAGGGPPHPDFRQDGDTWTLAFGGRSVAMRDSKGLRDLAALVGRPEQPVHVFELAGIRGEATGADPVLDDEARTAFRARLADLEIEIDEAEAYHDPVRAERARDEREALIAELSRAFGLGGRARRLGDDQERVRKTVTARVHDALRRVEQLHPPLGRHLRASVHTGTWCSYSPRSGPA